MATRLEPFYFSNVLLYLNNVETIKSVPLVSKRCHEAMLTLKTNPAMFSTSPREILKLFPNTNTMVVDDMSVFEPDVALPDTVTSLVVKEIDFCRAADQVFRYADRVVEIQLATWFYSGQVDFSVFPRLERLTVDFETLASITKPTHRLKHLTVYLRAWNSLCFIAFPPECAEQMVLVFNTRDEHAKAAAQPLPPHVHAFCNQIAEGLAEGECYPSRGRGGVLLSERFGVEQLRALTAALPFPFTKLLLSLRNGAPSTCDISFLTSVVSLQVCGSEKNLSLTTPTSVVRLSVAIVAQHATLSGTQNLTHFETQTANIAITPCPRLRELKWDGCSSSGPFPFASGDLTNLEALTLLVNTFPPGLQLPTTLTLLSLGVFAGSFTVGRLAPLTRLQHLGISVPENSPLDLSALTSLTALTTDFEDSATRITRVPASLVACEVPVWSDMDFSPLTRLTRLRVVLKAPVSLTFPTRLKKLLVVQGDENGPNRLLSSNASDVVGRVEIF